MQHSAEGYLAMLRMRKTATLLVEGTSDQVAMHQLLKQLPPSRLVVVDTAEMVQTFNGISGNREKAEAIHQLAAAENLPVGGFLDREFRDFDLKKIEDSLKDHILIGDSLFLTRGHSIENYFFVPACAIRFLKTQHLADLPRDFQSIVKRHFRDVLRLGASISLAARESQIINKSHGLFDEDCWILNGKAVEPNFDVIDAKLATRKIPKATIAEFRKNLTESFAKTQTCSTETLRWITHGHLGFEIMWSGLCFVIASSATVDSEVRKQISRGHRDLKLGLGVEHWAQRCLQGHCDRPGALLGWLQIP